MDIKTVLLELIARQTGVKQQSHQLQQALRYARGSLKSSLATKAEWEEHVRTINRLASPGA